TNQNLKHHCLKNKGCHQGNQTISKDKSSSVKPQFYNLLRFISSLSCTLLNTLIMNRIIPRDKALPPPNVKIWKNPTAPGTCTINILSNKTATPILYKQKCNTAKVSVPARG